MPRPAATMRAAAVVVLWLSSLSVESLAGESNVIGSNKPVVVAVADDVILPCHLEPQFDVKSLTVEWRRDKTRVHVYRNRKDDPGSQDENFKGRTSLFHAEMTTGNISLKLTNVTEKDAGTYTCFVPKLQSQITKGNVTLIVEPGDERKKGNQADDHKPDQEQANSGVGRHVSTSDIIGIAVTIALTAIFGFGVIWWRFGERQ